MRTLRIVSYSNGTIEVETGRFRFKAPAADLPKMYQADKARNLKPAQVTVHGNTLRIGSWFREEDLTCEDFRKAMEVPSAASKSKSE